MTYECFLKTFCTHSLAFQECGLDTTLSSKLTILPNLWLFAHFEHSSSNPTKFNIIISNDFETFSEFFNKKVAKFGFYEVFKDFSQKCWKLALPWYIIITYLCYFLTKDLRLKVFPCNIFELLVIFTFHGTQKLLLQYFKRGGGGGGSILIFGRTQFWDMSWPWWPGHVPTIWG